MVRGQDGHKGARMGAAARARRPRLAPWAWGVALGFFALVLKEGGALLEPNNICIDGVSTTDLFAAGAFHTCGTIGMTIRTATGQTAADYVRKVKCWGWEDFGQLDPPAIDHVTSLTAGARHTCATDRMRAPICWGSNLYGQLDLPRPAGTSRTYCRQGDYVADGSAVVEALPEKPEDLVVNLSTLITETE